MIINRFRTLRQCFIAGWGMTTLESLSVQTHLMEAEISILADTICEKIFAPFGLWDSFWVINLAHFFEIQTFHDLLKMSQSYVNPKKRENDVRDGQRWRRVLSRRCWRTGDLCRKRVGTGPRRDSKEKTNLWGSFSHH